MEAPPRAARRGSRPEDPPGPGPGPGWRRDGAGVLHPPWMLDGDGDGDGGSGRESPEPEPERPRRS
jgi:hypothetical protein